MRASGRVGMGLAGCRGVDLRGNTGVGEGLVFGDQAMEESAAGGADVVAALGVPLDAQEELGGSGMFHVEHWVVGGELDGFDDAVVRAASYDAQAVAGCSDGLMVAGVDGTAEETVG